MFKAGDTTIGFCRKCNCETEHSFRKDEFHYIVLVLQEFCTKCGTRMDTLPEQGILDIMNIVEDIRRRDAIAESLIIEESKVFYPVEYLVPCVSAPKYKYSYKYVLESKKAFNLKQINQGVADVQGR